MGKFLDKVLLWSGPVPLCPEQALGGGFVFLMDKNTKVSVSVCRNLLTSWLTGSRAHGGNVDTGLPRRAGWGPGSWRLWDVCHHHAGAKCSVRTSKVDFFLEGLAWMGCLDFTGALFTEFCGGGKILFTLRSQFSLIAIPICLWEWCPKFSSLWTVRAGIEFYTWLGTGATEGWKDFPPILLLEDTHPMVPNWYCSVSCVSNWNPDRIYLVLVSLIWIAENLWMAANQC